MAESLDAMTGDDFDDTAAAGAAVKDARRDAAAALARLAEAAVRYADARIIDDRRAAALSGSPKGKGRAKPGEFVADELALMLREQPYTMRCLLARSRRLAADLPTVWEAFRRGELDLEQVRVVDRAARKVTEASTLAAIDDQAVDAAQTRTPKQLLVWLLRLIVQLEPAAFEERHRRALADRRVTVVQGLDGMGYVTGEVTAADAAAIDAMLAASARSLGADDPRTEQQRRADLFADLLLGRLAFDDPDRDDDNDDDDQADSTRLDNEQLDHDQPDNDHADHDHPDPDSDEVDSDQSGTDRDSDQVSGDAGSWDWLEVEIIDPDTGEVTIQLQRITSDGEPVGEPIDPINPFNPTAPLPPGNAPRLIKRPRTHRIGIVVPIASLLGASDRPGELADRSGFMPAEVLKELIADRLDDQGCEVLFTRLLTDNGGRLLDVTELGRYPSVRLAQAIKLRAGTCRFPTCTVPADRCDIDHHKPVPRGPTAGWNTDPFCRRHHRGKTFAWLAALRDHDGVDWTMPTADRYRCTDQPLPTGWT